jgi:hypothetical protein
MVRLALILHIFIGSTFAGSAVVAALVMGPGTAAGIVGAALAGFLLSAPISYLVARNLYEA